MAIVKSIFIGKASKSVGGGTYRTVRGRTILSEKRGPSGGSATRGGGDGSVYQFNFALISRFIALHRADVNVSFNTTQYGSCGNYFYKVNRSAIETALNKLFLQYGEPSAVTDELLSNTITAYATEHPNAIYRVKKSGYEVKYLTGEWSSDDNPTPAPGPTPTAKPYITHNGTKHNAKIVDTEAEARSGEFHFSSYGGDYIIGAPGLIGGETIKIYGSKAADDEEGEIVLTEGKATVEIAPDPSGDTTEKHGFTIDGIYYSFID